MTKEIIMRGYITVFKLSIFSAMINENNYGNRIASVMMMTTYYRSLYRLGTSSDVALCYALLTKQAMARNAPCLCQPHR